MSCDTSASIPSNVSNIMQILGDKLREKCGCWRVHDTGTNSISTTVSNISDIVLNNGGIVDSSSARWAIYPIDDILYGKISDFEKHIYTGANPTYTAITDDSLKKDTILRCLTDTYTPINIKTKSREEIDNFSSKILLSPERAGAMGLRASNAKYNLNWYKTAQAAKFDPKDLEDVNKVSKFTKEQLQEAKAWIESKDGWFSNDWTDAQKPGIELLQKNYDKMLSAAETSSIRDIRESATTSGVDKLNARLMDMQSTINKEMAAIGLRCSDPSLNPESVTVPDLNSALAIQKFYSNVLNKNFASISSALNYLKIAKSSGSVPDSEQNKKYSQTVCNGNIALNAAINAVPKVKTYVNTVISDPAHADYKNVTKLLSDVNTEAGSIREEAGVGLRAG